MNLIGFRHALHAVVFSTLIGSLPANSETFSVRDPACRLQHIKECAWASYKASCKNGQGVEAHCRLINVWPLPDTEKEQVFGCGESFDKYQPGACLVPIDLDAILTELKATNKSIREDQRALMNGLCRSLSNQPDQCDDKLPPVTK